jgi:hypothetical protein
MDESADDVRQREAELLAQIGRSMFGQDLRITVELPAALAAAALAAWLRDDAGGTENESDAARTIRHEAGALALIGLAVEEHGAPADSDRVEVDLDAWQVGCALDAADQRGLLAGLKPPERNG